jgi:hypothetical protein
MNHVFRSALKLMTITFAAALVSASTAAAQSAPAPMSLDQMAPKAPVFSASVNVACGDLQKTSCAIVLPKVMDYSAPQGLTLVPVKSGGSVESAQVGVCPGIVPAAVGMADGFDAVLRLPQCQASFAVFGPPLFPYFGYLIVASANPASSLEQLVTNAPANTTVIVSDGKAGTGGQVTFSNVLATNPAFKRVISEDDETATASLAKVQSGAISGYFVMDSPGSPLLAKVMGQLDPSGKPVFKILDIRAGNDFYALRGVSGNPLYQEVTINPGVMGFGATKTISTNAELILNSAWARNPANAQTISILGTAADKAEAGILAASHSPSDWTGQASAQK